VASLLDDVDRLLQQPEDERLEFKSDARDPRQVARDLAAFANARGGLLVIGIDHQDGQSSVRGIDAPQRIAAVVERAVGIITPPIEYRVHELSVGGQTVYAIEVPEQSGAPFAVDGLLYVRRAERSVVATADLIKSLVVRRDESPAQMLVQLNSFADALARQEKLIESLQQSSTWQRQLLWTLLGAVLGTVLGVIATVLMS